MPRAPPAVGFDVGKGVPDPGQRRKVPHDPESLPSVLTGFWLRRAVCFGGETIPLGKGLLVRDLSSVFSSLARCAWFTLRLPWRGPGGRVFRGCTVPHLRTSQPLCRLGVCDSTSPGETEEQRREVTRPESGALDAGPSATPIPRRAPPAARLLPHFLA